MPAFNINQQQLQTAQIANNLRPDGGPKAIPIILDFTGPTTTEYVFDYQNLQQRGFFGMCQALYIDCSQSANDLEVTVGGTGQTIIAKAGTQGYYPVLCANPLKLVFDSLVNGALIPVFVLNMAISGQVWTS
jgi:hypothetical protein